MNHMSVNKTIIISLFILCFNQVIKAQAITVDIDGNGDYSTIQEAVNKLSSGDTLLVYPGIYNERVHLTTSGTEGNPIVIKSLQDTMAVLNGIGFNMEEWGNGIFHASNVKHVEFIGFKIQNSTANGVLFVQSKHIRISKCKTYNTQSSGIGVWNSKQVKVDSNEVVLACNDGSQECLTVAGCDSFEICYNHVHHGGPGTNGGEGIDAKHGTYGWIHHNCVHDNERLGIYVDAWNVDMHHIWVYSNIVHNCNAWGYVVANENGGFIRDVYVYNNLSYSNKNFGFGLEQWGVEGATHKAKNIHFYHNTAYKNATSGFGGGLSISCSDSDSIYVVDNIFAENSYSQFKIRNMPRSIFINNNIMYGPNTNGDYGTNAIRSNPLFEDAPNFNFRLTKNSPAIRQASGTYNIVYDFDGKERTNKADIGAYEYIPTSDINRIQTDSKSKQK